MDCEKFDQHVIDALYDELDEFTHAALKRHVEGCSRCAGIWVGLRATREVGVLPFVEPPDELEARILDAAHQAQKVVPIHRRVLRGLAWAGSHAMRPQLAMAALFFLVIGSSLLLLRARPGTLGPVAVSENGAPAPEMADGQRAAAAPQAALASAAPPAATASPAAPVAVAAAEAEGAADRGALERKAKSADDRAEQTESLAKDGAAGGAAEPRSALAAALAVRDSSGCAAAVAKLDEVAVRFAGTQAAADAMWHEANCFKQMGDRARAQQLFLALRSTGYRDRAQAELDDANANVANAQQQYGGGRVGGAARPAAPAAAPASPKRAAMKADADLANESAAKARAQGQAPPPAPARPAPKAAAGFAP